MLGIILSLLATLVALGFAFHIDDTPTRRQRHHDQQLSKRSSTNRAQARNVGRRLDDLDHPGSIETPTR